MMFKGRSKALFVGAVLATIYTIYLVVYFGNSMNSSDSAEAIGGALATALVTPHMILMGLGAIFAWVGFGIKKAWGALVGAILYSVAALIFIIYAVFCIPMIVFGFVGFANQRKLNKKAEAQGEFATPNN